MHNSNADQLFRRSGSGNDIRVALGLRMDFVQAVKFSLRSARELSHQGILTFNVPELAGVEFSRPIEDICRSGPKADERKPAE